MRWLSLALGITLVLPLTTATGQDARVTGKVLSVSADGLLRIQTAHDQLKVMPAGVALPPLGHPHRNAARKALGELVFDQTVEFVLYRESGSRAASARVFVAGQDIAPLLLSEGNAYVLRGHPLSGELLRFEFNARNARRGLWAYGEHKVP